MNAIPTKYAGVQFRSRIEARWAAFFDLMAWPWEYEPIDLAGYIPDFLLMFKEPLLVEVKPLLGSPFDWNCKTRNPMAYDALRKIQQSGWIKEGLLLGMSFYSGPHAMGFVPSRPDDRGRVWQGEPAANPGLLFDGNIGIESTGEVYANPFGFKACCGGPVDVVGYFNCRCCDDHDKGPTLMQTSELLFRWREAGNRVQWRSPAR